MSLTNIVACLSIGLELTKHSNTAMFKFSNNEPDHHTHEHQVEMTWCIIASENGPTQVQELRLKLYTVSFVYGLKYS